MRANPLPIQKLSISLQYQNDITLKLNCYGNERENF